jgi:hypothetical protein
LEEQKQQLLLSRQRNTIATRNQKRELLKMFEQLKVSRNWTKLSSMTKVPLVPL